MVFWKASRYTDGAAAVCVRDMVKQHEIRKVWDQDAG